MIEVEKKFRLLPGDEERLLVGATFLKEVTQRDLYFDRADFLLTTKDWWLRDRNGVFELKIPMNNAAVDQRQADQYRELDTDEAIRSALGLPPGSSIRATLEQSGFTVFAPIVTQRRKYQREAFIIDLDVMDFGYQIAEIELLVEKETEMKAAMEAILLFARQQQLTTAPVRGKVIEYIQRFRPEHFSRLVQAGVV